jgi:phage tail tape-measure protein
LGGGTHAGRHQNYLHTRGYISHHLEWVVNSLLRERATVGELVEELSTTSRHGSDVMAASLMADVFRSSAIYWEGEDDWKQTLPTPEKVGDGVAAVAGASLGVVGGPIGVVYGAVVGAFLGTALVAFIRAVRDQIIEASSRTRHRPPTWAGSTSP